jgi:hypothetical protein
VYAVPGVANQTVRDHLEDIRARCTPQNENRLMIIYDQEEKMTLYEFGIDIPVSDSRVSKTFEVEISQNTGRKDTRMAHQKSRRENFKSRSTPGAFARICQNPLF